ncbi:TolB family protein [Pyxidicoccus sp. 3LFB2]
MGPFLLTPRGSVFPSPRPFRFLAVLSTALLLTACGGDDDGEDSGKLSRTTLEAADGQYWGAPRFSPDGSRIAFTRTLDDGDTYEVAVMKADGTDVRMLANNGTYLTGTAWSPDGSRVYYSGEEGIFSVPAAGGTPVMEYDDFATSALDVSPDGKTVAYGTNGSGLTLLDLTTHTAQPLQDEGSSPAFSPDGKRLAYVTSGFDDAEVRVLTLATKQSTLVTAEASYLSAADWLPDGRLAALAGDGIMLFDLSGATPQGRLVRDEFAAKELDVSPDGKKMVYAINGRTDLFVLTGF